MGSRLRLGVSQIAPVLRHLHEVPNHSVATVIIDLYFNVYLNFRIIAPTKFFSNFRGSALPYPEDMLKWRQLVWQGISKNIFDLRP